MKTSCRYEEAKSWLMIPRGERNRLTQTPNSFRGRQNRIERYHVEIWSKTQIDPGAQGAQDLSSVKVG